MPAELYTETTYCNDEVKKEEFAISRYGKIAARDHFFDLREEAERNMTVFHKFPHIVKVIFSTPDQPEPIIEEHECPETIKKREEAG